MRAQVRQFASLIERTGVRTEQSYESDLVREGALGRHGSPDKHDSEIDACARAQPHKLNFEPISPLDPDEVPLLSCTHKIREMNRD